MKVSLGIKKLCAWTYQELSDSYKMSDSNFDFVWTKSDKFMADSIPKRNQRRMSNLSKLSVGLAATLTEDQNIDHAIFSSRYGELENSTQLVESIVDKDLLSPMAFSQSVHNTSSGLYSILKSEHCAMQAISAGEDSFVMGLVSAYSYLKNNPSANVLYVFSDWQVPDSLKSLVDPSEHSPKAVAMILSNKQEASFNFEIQANKEPEAEGFKDCEGFLSCLFAVDPAKTDNIPQKANWSYRAL